MAGLNFAPPAPSPIPVAIVGNINIDICTSPLPASPEIFSDGERSVGSIFEAPGGGGANTAIAAARLGGRVHFCGRIGRDAGGTALRRHLERVGVTPHLAEADAATGRSIALTWDNHHRHFLSHLPSCAELCEGDVDVDALARAGCRHLYRADVWFAPKMLDGGNVVLLRNARVCGMETSIDINWDPLWSRGDEESIRQRIERLAEALPYVTWVHGNERELCRFTGKADAGAAAESLLHRGAGGVIVHRGGQGSSGFTSGGERVDVAARPVRRVVNEIGTGDVFTAAFLLYPHLPLSERLRQCNEIAASHLEGQPDLLPPIG
jgi:ribokinase